jgi:hypothetical protein
VHFPLMAYNAFESHVWETRPGTRADALLFEIIANWLEADQARLAALAEKDSHHGAQWRELFLPHGTTLRTTVFGADHYANVVRDCLQHDGVRMSPSAFANRFGVAGRNAWKCIWVRFPGELDWIRASKLRTKVLYRQRRLQVDRERTKPPHSDAIS